MPKNKKRIYDKQNSSIKYKGFQNKYCYKSNMHNLIFKYATLENVRFNVSNITYCNFKKAKLLGVDFCNTNLKNTSFKGATLKNIIFINCNLKKTDFENVKFENVYFITTNIKVCKNIIIDSNITILNNYPIDVEMNDMGEVSLFRLGQINNIYNYHVLHVTRKKLNMWILKILYDRYGTKLNRAFKALVSRKNKRHFYTLSSYIQFIEKYFKL